MAMSPLFVQAFFRNDALAVRWTELTFLNMSDRLVMMGVFLVKYETCSWYASHYSARNESSDPILFMQDVSRSG